MIPILAALAAAASAAPPAEIAPFLSTCIAEGKRLWGTELCAPVVVVDEKDGSFRTSEAAPGPLPALRANTAFDWGGRTWIMVLAPLPGDPAKLNALLFHEAWHAHQKALGFPANTAVAGHLDEASSRYLIRLEWAALERALTATGAERRRHVAQALAFRRQRIGSDPAHAAAERDQMRHEGLAAYTGTVLSGDPMRLALEELRGGGRRAALGRSFAYVSAPAWGLLLDAYRPGWRRSREELDLPDMMPVVPAAVARADDYGGTAMLAEETLAGIERERRLAAALAATSEARGLRLPLSAMKMDFDPNRVSSAKDGSQLYEKISLADRWGRVRVDGPPLRIVPDFTAAFVPWPLQEGALELAEGWRVETREGGAPVLVGP